MKIKLESIEMDKTIQCRAEIDQALVNEYAERMTEGDEFPLVILFGANGKSWIGDGWHRIMAAGSVGFVDIDAEIHSGGRAEALKFALAANAIHGRKRTNADKRRCVEIALREFGGLSSRAVAEMCGVSNHMVDDLRPKALGESPNATRTTTDGRQYPAKRTNGKEKTDMGKENGTETKQPKRVLGPPCFGMQFARLALLDLRQIEKADVEKEQAFEHVEAWIENRRREDHEG